MHDRASFPSNMLIHSGFAEDFPQLLIATVTPGPTSCPAAAFTINALPALLSIVAVDLFGMETFEFFVFTNLHRISCSG